MSERGTLPDPSDLPAEDDNDREQAAQTGGSGQTSSTDDGASLPGQSARDTPTSSAPQSDTSGGGGNGQPSGEASGDPGSSSSAPPTDSGGSATSSAEEFSRKLRSLPAAWDVTDCLEFISNDEQIRARGRYRIDTSRGFDDERDAEFVKSGSFGMVVDVIDEGEENQGREFVMRISNERDTFEKQRAFSLEATKLLRNRQSPFFLEMRTAFKCSQVPPLGGDWLSVTPLIAVTFGGQDFFDDEFAVTQPIPFRLFYLILQRANLFNLAKMVNDWDRSTDDEVHRENPFKVVLFFQLLQGLAALHQSGITHRDIKLPNTVFSQRKTKGTFTFVFFDRKFRRRVYRVQEPTQVPGIAARTFQGRPRPRGFVRPHFIDWDFSMQAIGNQVQYYSKQTAGTPTNIAPEVVLLSAAGFNRTRNIFKPDVFSLGIMFGEIVTGYFVKSLLMLPRYNFDRKLLESGDFRAEGILYLTAAYVGFPTRAVLDSYERFIMSYLDSSSKTVDTASQREIASNSIGLLKKLKRTRKLIDAILARRRRVQLRDFIEQEWGISAAVFNKGVLFDFLEDRQQENAVSGATVQLLRRMLRWNPDRRPSSSSLLFADLFDQFLVNEVNESDSVWVLPVDRVAKLSERKARAATAAAATTQQQRTTPSLFPRIAEQGAANDDARTTTVVALDDDALFTMSEQTNEQEGGDDDDDATEQEQQGSEHVYHDFEDKVARRECLLPGCTRRSARVPTHSGDKVVAQNFCSNTCAQLYEKHDWLHSV